MGSSNLLAQKLSSLTHDLGMSTPSTSPMRSLNTIRSARSKSWPVTLSCCKWKKRSSGTAPAQSRSSNKWQNRHNDILSFHKEQFLGFNHNIIHLFRQDGFSQQEAYDQVSQLLNKRFRAWYLAQSEIPLWGEAVDVQVQTYIKGCQDMILANLNWR